LALLTVMAVGAGCAASAPEAATPNKKPAVAVGEGAKPAEAAAQPAAGELVVAVFPTVGDWATSKRVRHGASRGSSEAMPFSIADLASTVLTELKIEKQNSSYDQYGYGYNSYGGYRSAYHTATLVGFASGSLRIGAREVQVGGTNSGGPIYANCGQYEAKQPLRFEGIRSVPGGDVRYEVADGYWDGVACKAMVTTRKVVALSEIVPGKAYAFLHCEEEGCTGKRFLNVVFPEARTVLTQAGPLRLQSGQPPTRVSMQLRRGLAESVVVTQAQSGWKQSNVTVEVQQGVHDDEPIAVAFASE
jgi:hypothetical protein